MKILKTAVIFILALNLAYTVFTHFNKQQAQITQSAANTPDNIASNGLSLPALAELITKVRSGQELENKLNRKDSINNLDLNNDQKVDYLFVREFGDTQNKLGFSIYAEPAKNEKQEIASVVIEKNEDQAEIQVTGNQEIYGDNAVYNTTTKTTREVQENQEANTAQANTVFYPSYFMMRPLWYSPFYFGYYPPFYSPFAFSPYGAYRRRTVVHHHVTKGSNRYQAKSTRHITNPNKNMSASRGIAKNLRKPTQSQKSFYKTVNHNRKGGGFGHATSSHRLRPFSSHSRSFFTNTQRSRRFSNSTHRFTRGFSRRSFGGFGRRGFGGFGRRR